MQRAMLKQLKQHKMHLMPIMQRSTTIQHKQKTILKLNKPHNKRNKRMRIQLIIIKILQRMQVKNHKKLSKLNKKQIKLPKHLNKSQNHNKPNNLLLQLLTFQLLNQSKFSSLLNLLRQSKVRSRDRRLTTKNRKNKSMCNRS